MDAQEKRRQKHFINLIPSENFTSQAVLEALGSVMQSMSRAIALEGRG
jgi:glycine/serine hydroxymethyltransferase